MQIHMVQRHKMPAPPVEELLPPGTPPEAVAAAVVAATAAATAGGGAATAPAGGGATSYRGGSSRGSNSKGGEGRGEALTGKRGKSYSHSGSRTLGKVAAYWNSRGQLFVPEPGQQISTKYVLMREGVEIRQVQNQREAVGETLAGAVGEMLQDWARERQMRVQQQQQWGREGGEEQWEGGEGKVRRQQQQQWGREEGGEELRQEQWEEDRQEGEDRKGQLAGPVGGIVEYWGRETHMQQQQQQLWEEKEEGGEQQQQREQQGGGVAVPSQGSLQGNAAGGYGNQNLEEEEEEVEKVIVVVSDGTAHTGVFHVARDAGVTCIAVCSKRKLFFGAQLTLDWNKICRGEYALPTVNSNWRHLQADAVGS